MSLSDYLQKWSFLFLDGYVEECFHVAANVGNKILRESILMERMRTHVSLVHAVRSS